MRGPPPSIDLDFEVRLQKLVLALAREHLLASAHDLSEGGLLVALAECAATNPTGRDVGARLTLRLDADPLTRTGQLFGERPSRGNPKAGPRPYLQPPTPTCTFIQY